MEGTRNPDPMESGMASSATCPNNACGKAFGHLQMLPMTGSVPLGGGSWDCVVLACPHCGTAISAQVHPIRMRDEIVKEIARAFGFPRR
jgi:hypothetical protein